MGKTELFFKNIGRVKGYLIIAVSLLGLAIPVRSIWLFTMVRNQIVRPGIGPESQTVAGVSVGKNTESKAAIGSAEEQQADLALENPASDNYPLHRGVYATLFWVGEDASADNKNISNSPSAWDDAWLKHFGGVDNPKKRIDFYPSRFTPKENPFYVALPYNDFDKKGKRRSDVSAVVPWATEKSYTKDQSMLKNRWVKIMKGDSVVYAQWEDVGPFGENDSAYVFGADKPKSKTNKSAGIDLSPAVNTYLNLGDLEKVDWRFVDDEDVPDGPWKQLVTTSQVFWN
ncbi:MAG: hypothetical protein WCL23_03050 [Candidatus Moraniibacteriota bacterium]